MRTCWPAFRRAVEHPHQHHHAEVGVVPGVDQQGLQRRGRVALGRRQAGDDGLQHLVDAQAGLGRALHGVGGVDADDVLDLLAHPVRLGGRQVDLVQHRHDLVVVVDGLVDVGQGLGLDALAGVHHQDRALAGGQRAADLIGEVDVAGRVHQVEDIVLAVVGPVVEPHGLGLDGDAALALELHGVEHLLLHLARGQAAGLLDQAVGEGRLAVVDVGDDGEVADVGRAGSSWRRRSSTESSRAGEVRRRAERRRSFSQALTGRVAKLSNSPRDLACVRLRRRRIAHGPPLCSCSPAWPSPRPAALSPSGPRRPSPRTAGPGGAPPARPPHRGPPPRRAPRRRPDRHRTAEPYSDDEIGQPGLRLLRRHRRVRRRARSSGSSRTTAGPPATSPARRARRAFVVRPALRQGPALHEGPAAQDGLLAGPVGRLRRRRQRQPRLHPLLQSAVSRTRSSAASRASRARPISSAAWA